MSSLPRYVVPFVYVTDPYSIGGTLPQSTTVIKKKLVSRRKKIRDLKKIGYEKDSAAEFLYGPDSKFDLEDLIWLYLPIIVLKIIYESRFISKNVMKLIKTRNSFHI